MHVPLGWERTELVTLGRVAWCRPKPGTTCLANKDVSESHEQEYCVAGDSEPNLQQKAELMMALQELDRGEPIQLREKGRD